MNIVNLLQPQFDAQLIAWKEQLGREQTCT